MDVRQDPEAKKKGVKIEDKLCVRECLLEDYDGVCGCIKGPVWHQETWWWNDIVDNAIKEKRRQWKGWKAGGSKESYLKTKTRLEIYTAEKQA